MAIQLSIPQPTGVTATYHVVESGTYSNNTLSANVSSYLDQPSFAASKAPLATHPVDVSFVLSQTAANPPTGANIGQVVTGIIQSALISQPSGLFLGGTIVA